MPDIPQRDLDKPLKQAVVLHNYKGVKKLQWNIDDMIARLKERAGENNGEHETTDRKIITFLERVSSRVEELSILESSAEAGKRILDGDISTIINTRRGATAEVEE